MLSIKCLKYSLLTTKLMVDNIIKIKQDKLVIRDRQHLEEVFQNRLKQFDEKRWKKIQIQNCVKGMSFYAVLDYEKKENVKENVIKMYLVDKQGYDRLYKEKGMKKGKGTEFLNNFYEPFMVDDIIEITIAGTDVKVDDSYDIEIGEDLKK